MSWEAASAGLVIILGAIFKFVLDWQKGKREERSSNERLQVLRDIALSNQAIREGQVAQNGKLSAIMEVNNTRHAEVIRALNSSCKAKPIFHVEEPRRRNNI